MSKRVVLRLEGDINRGFRVGVEIGEQGQQPDVEMQGQLPEMPHFSQNLRQWQLNYQRLGVTTRLKPGTVNHYSGNDWIPTTPSMSFQECRSSSEVLQQNLVNWLESPQFRRIDKLLREELNRDDTIQFMIRSDDASVMQLPWHVWDFIERYPKAEVTFGSLDSRRITRQRKPKEKVRILAILGNSTGINVESDRRMLANLPDADVHFLVEPQRQAINDRLWNQDWDILFFAGHSETIGSKGIIHINRYESISIEDLRYGLSQAISNGLQLAIFNSCDGLGLAKELEQLHIPQMIVMRQPVPDAIAQEFLKFFLNFYAEKRQPFHIAERKAREYLQGLESTFPCASWLPIIFQNPVEVPPTWNELLGKQPNSYRFRQSESNQSTPSSASLDNELSNANYQVSAIHLTNKKENAPLFDEKEVVKITLPPGAESEKAKVKETIHPYRVGRVWYQGTFWNACFYHPERSQTVEAGQEVEAWGTWQNYLLVMPYKEKQPEKPKGGWHSFFSSIRTNSQ